MDARQYVHGFLGKVEPVTGVVNHGDGDGLALVSNVPAGTWYTVSYGRRRWTSTQERDKPQLGEFQEATEDPPM